MSRERARGLLAASLLVVLLATACGGGLNFTVGEERIAGFAWDGKLEDAINVFGDPASRDGVITACTLKWPDYGITMETSINPFVSEDPCVDAARHRFTTVTDERWQTDAGLRIGDSLERLRELYPDAEPGINSDEWSLAIRPFADLPFPSLEARLADDRVVAFTVYGPRDPQ